MIFLEINEFSPELMTRAAELLGAKNLKRLLNLKHSETTTDDKFERFGLDPWVQWVSIHTGKTSSQHGVGHLGDVPLLDHPQIWERLSDKGVSSGIWGAMNASKGSAVNCKFFFPDPWSFSERAYPEELNKLLAFPRYYSKNYGDLDKSKAFLELLKLVSFCIRPSIMKTVIPLMPELIKHLHKYGMSEYLLFVLFDLVNASIFATYYKKNKPDFSLIFLNSLAHLQHHKWTTKNGLSKEMEVAFCLFDKVLGIIFSLLESSQPLIIANAFSQYCSYDKNEFLYRQKNPEKFLNVAKISFVRVEQAMTNDGHVFFRSHDDALRGTEILRTATVDGDVLFYVELDPRAPEKVFFQVTLWKELSKNAVMRINGMGFNFFDQFDQVTQRSGSHLQRGDVFSEGFVIPDKIYNHELYDYITKFFDQ